MNSKYEPYYNTEINTHFNYSILESYIKNKKINNNLSEEIIQKLEDCRQKICNSKTYFDISKKQNLTSYSTSDRWKMINLKKNILSNVFIILNKLTVDNLHYILDEMKEIKLGKYEDFVKISDIFAGKCTLETDNLFSLIIFLKHLNTYENWYVKHNDYIFSFRELILITIQKEFNKLIDMAGDMEKRYINSVSLNDEITNEFVKKKKIILGLIQFLAELFNNKLFSDIVNMIILKKLYDEYQKNNQYIYLELFIVYFKHTYINLKINNNQTYNDIIRYMTYIIDNSDIPTRITFIINSLLSMTSNKEVEKSYSIIENKQEQELEENDILNLDDQLEYLLNEYFINLDFAELVCSLEKKNFNNNKLLDYIFKYLASSLTILNDKEINKLIKKILLKFNINYSIVENRLLELINNDDIISELPLIEQIKIDNII